MDTTLFIICIILGFIMGALGYHLFSLFEKNTEEKRLKILRSQFPDLNDEEFEVILKFYKSLTTMLQKNNYYK